MEERGLGVVHQCLSSLWYSEDMAHPGVLCGVYSTLSWPLGLEASCLICHIAGSHIEVRCFQEQMVQFNHYFSLQVPCEGISFIESGAAVTCLYPISLS